VELSKSEFERAADIWQTYVLDGGAEPVLLAGASPSKLEVPLPALKQGVVSAEQAAADAESMTRRDLRDHYRALLGTEDDPDPEPERRSAEVWDGAKAHSGGDSGDGDESRRRDEVDEDGQPWESDMVRADGTVVDADELVRWAESYGHPETWAKKAQDLDAKNERLESGSSRPSSESPWKDDSTKAHAQAREPTLRSRPATR
jgi:hypothetical protein